MNKLRELREKNGLSLAGLQDITGVSKGYLSDMENGRKSNPSLDVLQRVANALKVSIGELTEENQ